MTIFGVLAVLAGGGNIAAVLNGIRIIDNLATKDYVIQTVQNHANQAQATLDSLADELRRVRAYTEVVPELRNLLALRCMGTPNLDTTIDRLEREFLNLTGSRYQEPPCEQLLATTR